MKTVIANFKMYKQADEIEDYIETIKGKIRNDLDVVLCPPNIYLNLFKAKSYHLGAQNCYFNEEGKYTGEVSPFQLRSIGVDYIIVGHSERRIYFGETNEVSKNNIKAVLCIGENKIEKDLHKTAIVIKKQLLNALNDIETDQISNVIIAYEPVYAIGTGAVPSIKDIEEVVEYINSIIIEKYNYNDIKILYGGSVDLNNINDIMRIKKLNGVLIGGACLDPYNFIKILNSID
jgi:triosephosphate isomerase